jgi:hypothetical protein
MKVQNKKTITYIIGVVVISCHKDFFFIPDGFVLLKNEMMYNYDEEKTLKMKYCPLRLSQFQRKT